MKIYSLVFKSILIFCLTFILSCSKQSIEPIKIGINPWPGYEFLYLAQELGLYKELGVPVKIIEYGSLSDVRRGYERGNLDAMATTLIELLQVKNNSSRDPQIFLLADFSNGGDVIIARNSITNPTQLKGKKVGADTSSLPVFLLARALELNGLELSDITLVPLEQGEMEKAYINREIDAAVTYPPVSVRLGDRSDSQVIFSSKEIPGEIIDIVSMEKSVLESRPDDVKKILQAWDKALDYTTNNPKEAHAIMAKREGISAQEFSEALNDLQLISLQNQKKYFPLLKPTLKKVRNVLVETGVLAKDTSADCCVPDIH